MRRMLWKWSDVLHRWLFVRAVTVEENAEDLVAWLEAEGDRYLVTGENEPRDPPAPKPAKQ